VFDFISTSQSYLRSPSSSYDNDPIELVSSKTAEKNSIKLYNFKNTQYTGEVSIGE